MPAESKAQHRMMCAACKGKGKKGVDKDVACEYCHAGTKEGAPERVEKHAEGVVISITPLRQALEKFDYDSD